jgi:hypothetical protein
MANAADYLTFEQTVARWSTKKVPDARDLTDYRLILSYKFPSL